MTPPDQHVGVLVHSRATVFEVCVKILHDLGHCVTQDIVKGSWARLDILGTNCTLCSQLVLRDKLGHREKVVCRLSFTNFQNGGWMIVEKGKCSEATEVNFHKQSHEIPCSIWLTSLYTGAHLSNRDRRGFTNIYGWSHWTRHL